MARTARRGNVRAIRPGLAIPPQREDDTTAIVNARIAASFSRRAYDLAQTEPNSRDHRLALHMAGIEEQLPRNNLRLLVTPPVPRTEWFGAACRKMEIAKAERDLAESQWRHAWHLDLWDEGNRAESLAAARAEKAAALDLAILDALRTPSTKRGDVTRKQDMIGKREWATKYRPEWQSIVDEDFVRFPTKARAARVQEDR